MSNELIIGYGNTLRSDDGLGWHAARHLAQVYGENDIQVIACHQLTPELAKTISQADYVVFIDASWVDSPGEICEKEILPEPVGEVVWNHVMNPISLLSYTKHLYGVCPRAVVFSIGGQSFGFGESVSAPVSKALPDLFARIQDRLANLEKEVA